MTASNSIDSIRALVSLFDDQGNLVADFNAVQKAVLGGYDILSIYAREPFVECEYPKCKCPRYGRCGNASTVSAAYEGDET